MGIFIDAYLHEGDKIREYCSYLKMMMQVHLHVSFFTIILLHAHQLNDSEVSRN